jgi:hypothetical protein
MPKIIGQRTENGRRILILRITLKSESPLIQCNWGGISDKWMREHQYPHPQY